MKKDKDIFLKQMEGVTPIKKKEQNRQSKTKNTKKNIKRKQKY